MSKFIILGFEIRGKMLNHFPSIEEPESEAKL